MRLPLTPIEAQYFVGGFCFTIEANSDEQNRWEGQPANTAPEKGMEKAGQADRRSCLAERWE